MPDVKIELLKDGPILITGPISLKDSAGADIPVTHETIAMCRCGHSGIKPFCDGSHKREGFQAD
ncbi:MAG TPA: CDGSH iron-sulfur domain-containing protein [Armatimonadota bacterium]|jgi:CDGSH-type Zn-finger protein